MVTFIPEYAAYLLNRLEVRQDGKTAYERCRGKSAIVVGLEFREKVLWRKKKGDNMAKLRSRWAYRIFVGVKRRSGELWIAAKTGEIVKTRAVKRLAEDATLDDDSEEVTERWKARLDDGC